jgi:NADH-quinone oxidoreductase subunit H
MSTAALPPERRPATPMARQILEHRSLLQRALALPGEARFVLAVLGLVKLAVLAGVGFLVVSGALDGRWYDIRDLGNGMAHFRYWAERNGVSPAVPYLLTGILGGVGILSLVGGWLVIGVWVERRLIAKFQIRQGPNRVGPFGLLQPLADAVKLLQKEVLIPLGADRLLFFLPPILIFIPAMLGWGPIPWAAKMSYADLNVGVVYVIAISSLGVLAVFLAGWSSNNHYALLGAMRTVAMMVSYEIPISISLLTVVLFTGSLQLSQIVAWQQQYHIWMLILLPFGAFTFLFASTAEINRTPNDIGEAESEIVAGFHTEYSGMKAGLFLAVELGNALLVGAMVSTFFLGGYTMFGLETWIPGYLILAVKTLLVYGGFVWLRATLPRFRLDQLMTFAWKFLIPLSIIQLLVVAVESLVIAQSGLPGIATVGGSILMNAGLTYFGVRAWANAIGYAPKDMASPPIMTNGVGGLRAAERIQAAQ